MGTIEKAGLNKPQTHKNFGDYNEMNTDREVFITGLNYDVTDDELRTYLEGKAGTITRLHMPRKKGDASKAIGFAWASFKDADSMTKALALYGEEFHGRPIKLEKAGKHRER